MSREDVSVLLDVEVHSAHRLLLSVVFDRDSFLNSVRAGGYDLADDYWRVHLLRIHEIARHLFFE